MAVGRSIVMSMPLNKGLGHLLALELRELVVVLGLDRAAFVAGRVFHVAVHALGAAVDNLSDPGRPGGIEQVAHGVHVGFPVNALWQVHAPECGGQVEDDLSALHEPGVQAAIGHASQRDPRPVLHKVVVCDVLLVVEHGHLVPTREQAVDEMAAGEAGAAGYEYFHECLSFADVACGGGRTTGPAFPNCSWPARVWPASRPAP